MKAREIQCASCGSKGEIEGLDHRLGDRDIKIFRHLGHDPFSGHLHYRCPSCTMVLLVHPMDVLEGNFLRGNPVLAEGNDLPIKTVIFNLLHKLPVLRGIFQNNL